MVSDGPRCLTRVLQLAQTDIDKGPQHQYIIHSLHHVLVLQNLLEPSKIVLQPSSEPHSTRVTSNPGNGKTNKFLNTILLALGIVPVNIHPGPEKTFSPYRRAHNDEICQPQPKHLFPKILSPRAITAFRPDRRLPDHLHHRFKVARALSDHFMVRGGRDEIEVFGELGDPCEMNRRDDVAEGGIHKVGEPDSERGSVHSKGLGSIHPCEQAVWS